MLKALLTGFCLGAANIIPGVSGGTFLLIFNLYGRVFSALNTIDKDAIRKLLSLCLQIIKSRFTPGSIKNLLTFLSDNDLIFLFKLTAGAAIAIVSLSALIKYLLASHFCPTYALFFGLILVSIVIPMKMLRSRTVFLVLFALIGAGLTIFLTVAVDPYAKAVKKSKMYEAKYHETRVDGQGTAVNEATDRKGFFSFSNQYEPDEYLFIMICGAVAVSAMVLPGISGSLVLILLGQYYTVIGAISELKRLSLDSVFFLTAFAFGMILGLLLFSRFVTYVFKRYHDATVSFLLGLMAGSLYALWPFKKAFTITHQYVRLNGSIAVIENAQVFSNINILPESFSQAITALLFCAAGSLIMFMFIKPAGD
ncbi:MAG: DUF368 domain-containing protein [Desulfobacteraceae bacterium]|nr:MAG: DUF368 domain-containing protein [Desulfobacteraceae bacterium]